MELSKEQMNKKKVTSVYLTQGTHNTTDHGYRLCYFMQKDSAPTTPTNKNNNIDLSQNDLRSTNMNRHIMLNKHAKLEK